MTEVLILNIYHALYMISIEGFLDPIILQINLIDHLTEEIPVTDTAHVHIQEKTRFQCVLLLRHPSIPRDSRYSRSRSNSHTRNKLKTIQSQTSNNPINFEKHMYQPTQMATAITPTSWFYSLCSHTQESQNKNEYPS